MAQVSQQTNVGGQWALGRPNFSQPPLRLAVGKPSNSNSPPAGVVAPPLLRKQREALGRSRRHISRQNGLPLLAPSEPNRRPVSETQALRVEFEQLRQEMESIRRTGDAPPEYS